jgi:DNA polymerase I
MSLIEAPLGQIDDAVATTRGVMAEAAAVVLGPGLWIDTDVDIVRYPDRYSDPRGQIMWDRVTDLLDEVLRVLRVHKGLRVVRVHKGHT